MNSKYRSVYGSRTNSHCRLLKPNLNLKILNRRKDVFGAILEKKSEMR